MSLHWRDSDAGDGAPPTEGMYGLPSGHDNFRLSVGGTAVREREQVSRYACIFSDGTLTEDTRTEALTYQ